MSPVVGGMSAPAASQTLDNAPLASVDKRRERAGESRMMTSSDVEGHFWCCSTTWSIRPERCERRRTLKERCAPW